MRSRSAWYFWTNFITINYKMEIPYINLLNLKGKMYSYMKFFLTNFLLMSIRDDVEFVCLKRRTPSHTILRTILFHYSFFAPVLFNSIRWFFIAEKLSPLSPIAYFAWLEQASEVELVLQRTLFQSSLITNQKKNVVQKTYHEYQGIRTLNFERISLK